MLLKNNSKSVQQFSLGGSLGESRFIQVPAMATVELDDKDWESLVTSRTRAQVYESVQEPIGTEEFGQAKIGKDRLFKTVKVPTGRFHYINLTLEMVKEGRLVVIEAPKSGLSVEKLVARINLVKGLSVDAEEFSIEELEGIYMENRAKIEEAIEARKAVKDGQLSA